MHIHHLALRVRDFEKSLHFYQTLTELKIHTQFSANGGSIAYLQNASGETQLELIGMGGRDRQRGCSSASVRRISPARMSVPSCTA